MEELRNSHSVSDHSSKEVKTNTHDYTNSRGSQEINHQRVSVREIIADHYRRGK